MNFSLWMDHVQENDGGVCIPGRLNPGWAIEGRQDFEPGAAQGRGDQLAQRVIVIDDQDRACSHGSPCFESIPGSGNTRVKPPGPRWVDRLLLRLRRVGFTSEAFSWRSPRRLLARSVLTCRPPRSLLPALHIQPL